MFFARLSLYIASSHSKSMLVEQGAFPSTEVTKSTYSGFYKSMCALPLVSGRPNHIYSYNYNGIRTPIANFVW